MKQKEKIDVLVNKCIELSIDYFINRNNYNKVLCFVTSNKSLNLKLKISMITECEILKEDQNLKKFKELLKKYNIAFSCISFLSKKKEINLLFEINKKVMLKKILNFSSTNQSIIYDEIKNNKLNNWLPLDSKLLPKTKFLNLIQ